MKARRSSLDPRRWLAQMALLLLVVVAQSHVASAQPAEGAPAPAPAQPTDGEPKPADGNPADANAGAEPTDANQPAAPNQAAPDQAAPDQAAPDQAAPDQADAAPQEIPQIQDGARDDPKLSPGTLFALVLDENGLPVPNIEAEMTILTSSVQTGDSTERREIQTNDVGIVELHDLPVGLAHSYQIAIERDSASFKSHVFQMNDRAGKRVVMHVYPVVSDIAQTTIGFDSIVFVSVLEDSLRIEHVLDLYNLGKSAWRADVAYGLPPDYKAFNKGDDEPIFDEDGVAAIRGTFVPGQHRIAYNYQVPLEGNGTQAFDVPLPPRVMRARVMSESSPTMKLVVTGFPAASKTTGRDGRSILVTESQVGRGHPGMSSLSIRMDGLPVPSWGRWIAVVLAIVAVGIAAQYVRTRRDDRDLPDDTRRDLSDAREALLDEIVALERARRAGDVGPKAYDRIRLSLVDAIARITAQIGDERFDKRTGPFRSGPRAAKRRA